MVFEAGGGCGRTCWDPVLPLLAGAARLVAYDRAGRAHQRRYADSLPDGRYEIVDSAHLLQAEQPQLLAARIRQLPRSDGV